MVISFLQIEMACTNIFEEAIYNKVKKNALIWFEIVNEPEMETI